jgi:hypothetical protein
VARFLVPVIVWRFVRLAEGRPLRRGPIFGAVLAYQAFINPETLLYTTISVMVFAAAYAALRPREARAIAPKMISGLAMGGLTALLLLATPVWYQFFGPQDNGAPPQDAQPFHADVLDYVGWPVTSSLVDPEAVGRWTTQVYPVLGLPVVLVLLVFGWRLRRNPLFGATVAVLAACTLFSLGTVISLRHVQDVATYTDDGFPGPWRLIGRLPVFQWVVPERWGMMAAAAAGVCIAFILDHALKQWRQGVRVVPGLAAALTLAALATLKPDPFPTMPVAPVPHFVTAGTWRQFVAPGGSLVPVPAAWDSECSGLRWAAAANGDIAIPGGYFLGSAVGGKGTTFGVPDRWTTTMLKKVAFTGTTWDTQPGDREKLLQDLRYWRASVIVLRPGQRNAAALRTTLESFLGPATEIDDVWLWDVRPLTG